MSAGTGIRHSEFNASASEAVHFLQIWIRPERAGLAPGYEQAALPAVNGVSRLDLIGGRRGSDQAGGKQTVTIHQDVALWRASLQPGESMSLPLASGRAAWVQVVHGRATVNGCAMAAGDGAAIEAELEVVMIGSEAAELLVFDLP